MVKGEKSKKTLFAKSRLSMPKITLDRFGQLIFTIREVTKIAIKINPRLIIFIFIISALWGLLAVPGFYLEKLILDRLFVSIGSSDMRAALTSVGVVVVARVLLEIFRDLLSRLKSLYSGNMARYFDVEVSLMIGKKLSELDMATIEDPEFKNKFNKIERESGRRSWGLMMPLTDIPNYLFGFITVVGVLFILTPWLALGVLLFSLPQFFVNRKFIRKDYELHTELTPKYRLWGWLNNYLVRNRNFMEAKILNLSGYLAKRIKNIQTEVLGKRTDLRKKREFSRFASLLPLMVLEFAISLWLITLVVAEKITIGSFEMYLRSLRSAQMNLTGLMTAFMEIYENYIYVVDLVWLLNLRPGIEVGKKGINVDKGKPKPVVTEKISFRYRDDQDWILKGIDLRIEPGERVAIVGENGAGKSTLIKLIARFYDPQVGDVFYGKYNLRDVNLSQWRSKLGILFQMFETYPFSSKETIGYGDIKRIGSVGEIKQSAHKAGIDEYIESLPLKYENPLAPELEKGVNPSIGQWQKFGISRMLFRKGADIMIMDEPTSNVDPKAEEEIFNELLKKSKGKRKIFIFVSQRFSTVRRADRILVMHKGKIVERGTHEELMKIDGRYAKLFNLQAKRYK